MDFERMIELLKSTQNDPDAASLATFDILISTADELLRQAVEAAAIPHWFDAKILQQLVDINEQSTADAVFRRITALPFCESFEQRNGFNVQKGIRNAIRSRLFRDDPKRFQSLTTNAKTAFDQSTSHHRIESAYHQLWLNAEEAGPVIRRLEFDLRHSEEDSMVMAATFQDCLAIVNSTPLINAWAIWIQGAVRARYLATKERQELLEKCLNAATAAQSDYAIAAVTELFGDLFFEIGNPERALIEWKECERILKSIVNDTGKSREIGFEEEQIRSKISVVSIHEKRVVTEQALSIKQSLKVEVDVGNLSQQKHKNTLSTVSGANAKKTQRFLFLSAVTNEFGAYRKQVQTALAGPHIWIETQETFLAFGNLALVELDTYIQKCDAVIHLVGVHAGTIPSPLELDSLFSRYPNLPVRLGINEPFLRTLTYTQWEAWLAVFHQRPLYIAQANRIQDANGTSGDPLFAAQMQSQTAHLAGLQSRGHYPQQKLAFDTAEQLVIALLKSIAVLLETDEVRAAIDKLNERFTLVTGTELINQAQIERQESQQVVDTVLSSTDQGALLVAAAGFGKSCILAQVIERLKVEDVPFVAFKLDSIPESSNADRLGHELGLTESPVTTLARISQGRRSVLIVDQLDAISIVSGRKTNTWEAFAEIWKELRQVAEMKMVVACRDFDLNQDHRLRHLTAKNSGFKTISVGNLSEADLRMSLDKASLKEFVPNDRQKQILSLPFHLLLFLQGYPNRPFSRVGDLYNAYWDRKKYALREILGRDGFWNQVIDSLTNYMSSNQCLLAPKVKVEDWDSDAKAMVSAHVLIDVNKGYQFFHESFFDYAYARRFCSRDQSLLTFLMADEQHLFRRAQVRQILGFRRENEPSQYYRDLREVLSSSQVRFHIKRMVASEFRRITDPRAEEWDILSPYVLQSVLSRYVSSALRDHAGWFDLLNILGIWTQWLSASDGELVNAAIWFLEARDLHNERSARIAQLLEPYSTVGGEWDDRLKRILSWGIAHLSEQMTSVYFTLIERGVYDGEDCRSGNRDFWGNHYEAGKTNPQFIVDLTCLWLKRTVQKYDDGESWNFMDKSPLNHSHTGSQLIGNAAAAKPDYFVKELLPIFVENVRRTEKKQYDRLLNRTWPYLNNSGDPLDINDAILIYLRRALQHLAKSDVDSFRSYADSLKLHHHETICYLVLSGFSENPKEFADECVRYLLDYKPRLNIGYGSWSGVMGHGESAVSRIAIKAVSPFCNVDLFRQLEDAVIEYCDEYEAATTGRRGFGELLVLRSIAPQRRSNRANVRIDELECSFPLISDEIPPTDESMMLKFVGSPISSERAALMTDEQWVSAMLKYDGTTDRFRGGPIELSRSLQEFTRKDRNRFANLALSLPEQIQPVYYSAILDGLTSQYANIPADEKKQDDEEIARFPLESFLRVIRKLHLLPNRPCGSAIAHCIGRLAERAIPEELLDILADYAINDPDPLDDIWQDREKNYYGGDPYAHGINCVRGQAAVAIGDLLFRDTARFPILKAATVSLIHDPVISVRACAICSIIPLLNADRDVAVSMFLDCCGESESLWTTPPFQRFIRHAIRSHYPNLRSLLQSALSAEDDNVVETAATEVVLAELDGIDVNNDGEEIRRGSDVMRKAAAHVYSQNVSHSEVGDRAAQFLKQFFYDDSEEVREHVSNAFWNLSGERLFDLESMIQEFIESDSFTAEPDCVLRSLEESRVELPHVVCRAAERILDFLGQEGTHIAHRGASVAHSISKLIVRQYAQANDPDLKRHCLDLIDQMERIGYMGISEELDKLDR